MPHGGDHGQNPCDAACQKLLLDAAMAGIKAGLYGRVLLRVDGLRGVDYELPQTFVEQSEAILKAAQFLNTQKLSTVQRTALMANSDEQCYRGQKFEAWAFDQDITPAKAETWSTKMREWMQIDQDLVISMLKSFIDGDVQ